MSRSRDIGTAAETAIVRYAREHGFPMAERRALRGKADAGDVLLCPGIIVESKAGEAARGASDALIHNWLEQTERERRNAGAHIALLVTVRPNIGPRNAGRWWAHLRSDHHGGAPVRMHLANALTWLRTLGYGDPVEPEPALRGPWDGRRGDGDPSQVSQVPPATFRPSETGTA